MKCACDEGRSLDGGPLRGRDGREHPESDQHDCEYVKARNRLIPEASRLADTAILARTVTDLRFSDELVRNGSWTEEFAKAMERLAREKLPRPMRATS